MTTLNRGYEKPDVDSPMASDCQRLQNALDAIDTDVHDLLSSASSTYTETRASALLDTIKTVDGPGSGLDADTLDGIQGAGFTLISHTGAGGTAHSAATSASAGFMTTTQVIALDSHLGAGGTAHSAATSVSAGFMTTAQVTSLDSHLGAGGTAHSAATSASAGFMTTAHVESVQLLLANMAKAGRAFFMRG